MGVAGMEHSSIDEVADIGDRRIVQIGDRLYPADDLDTERADVEPVVLADDLLGQAS